MSGSGEIAIDCSVSVDGKWLRRGHGSHYGVVSNILVETGKCVDIEVLSNTQRLFILGTEQRD